jgi:hypothetical protein
MKSETLFEISANIEPNLWCKMCHVSAASNPEQKPKERKKERGQKREQRQMRGWNGRMRDSLSGWESRGRRRRRRGSCTANAAGNVVAIVAIEQFIFVVHMLPDGSGIHSTQYL